MDLPNLKFGPFECRTLYGEDRAHPNRYMSQVILGRLRLHVFHRGDNDPDPHDHPWPFTTFPLVSYVEEVTWWRPGPRGGGSWTRRRQTVKAWRFHRRGAEHLHRVLGKAHFTHYQAAVSGKTFTMATVVPGPVVTLVWTGASKREWRFLKAKDGRYCWVAWRDYVFGGGKHAPCEEDAKR